jgi:hypothetical protein
LQTPPVHGVLAGWLVTTHVPALQVAGAVHWLPSSAQSPATTQPVQAPLPLQTPPVHGVLAGWFVTTHVPAGQVAGAVHWFPSSRQSVGVKQSTHAPAPLQRPSPIDAKLHAVPEGDGVLPGQPLTGLQVPSSVHWLVSLQLTPPQASATQMTLSRRVWLQKESPSLTVMLML